MDLKKIQYFKYNLIKIINLQLLALVFKSIFKYLLMVYIKK